MEFDPGSLTAGECYKLLAGGIVPRPIAVVSTVSASGRRNVAPFSFFNGVSANPMALMFSPVTKSDGTDKDSLRNALPVKEGGTGQFVVNLGTLGFVREFSVAADPADVDEFEHAGLTALPSRVVKAPRVGEAPISYECETVQVVRLAPGVPLSGNVVIGRVVHVWVNDDLLDDRLHIDSRKLAPLGRMSGREYTRATDRFEMPRGPEALSWPDPAQE